MTSYGIKHNPHLIEVTFASLDNNLLSFITQCLTQSLQLSWSL